MPKETVPKEIIEILGSIDLTHPCRMAHFHRLYNVVSESLSGQVLKAIETGKHCPHTAPDDHLTSFLAIGQSHSFQICSHSILTKITTEETICENKQRRQISITKKRLYRSSKKQAFSRNEPCSVCLRELLQTHLATPKGL